MPRTRASRAAICTPHFSLAFRPPVARHGDMTRRTRRLVLLTLPAGPAVALVAAWLLWPRTAITRENAARIQLGMTLAEVEEILGGPARDESGGKLVGDVDGKGDADPEERQRRIDVNTVLLELMEAMVVRTVKRGRLPHDDLFWVSDQAFVHVRFDQNNRVSLVSIIPVRRADDAVLDRLRRWLGL
jgi:hypothetical protein